MEQNERKVGTIRSMSACNSNRRYAVYISHAKQNDGAMHRIITKMIKTSNGYTVHGNKTCTRNYVMNTTIMCYIHALSFNKWSFHIDVLVKGTSDIHQQLHVSFIKIKEGKKWAHTITQGHLVFTTNPHRRQHFYTAQNSEH